ncbi:MAG: metallophosphoesterase [Alphaproteobacteria bacterium]|nr:metallophosphoesterase [Alphaproteobacteria bacterium]MDP6566928.1 metallophosphoesterase [Alphaproteobacteria bacterium]MDP6815871.1 metallophosphoesterase [Alphaproteobacteria bacterium]
MTLRIVQISDSHLGASRPNYLANWRVCRDEIRRLAPDLVINTGDVSLDGADSDDDLALARQLHDELGCPYRVIPGNHDIGDDPASAAAGAPGQVIDDERRARFRAVFGDDFWRQRIGDWDLIGLNAQLIGSDLAGEAEQWDFLLQALADADGPIALFVHKPLFAHDPSRDGEVYRYLAPAARDRLFGLMADRRVKLVGTGHVHQWLRTRHLGAEFVWAPSTAFIIGDAAQPVIGEKLVGLILYELDGDGVRVDLCRPAGMQPHDIVELIRKGGADLPAAYRSDLL